MQRLINILLGIDAPSWTEGGQWRLEWLSLPTGDRMLLLLAGVLIAAVGVWWLYRWEGRHVSAGARWCLRALRFAVLALGLMMLLEPMLVLSREELVPSHLLVLIDSSQSMGLRDAWQDEAAGTRAASRLQLTGGVGTLRTMTRLELVSHVFDDRLLKSLENEGARIVHGHTFADRLTDEALVISRANAGPGARDSESGPESAPESGSSWETASARGSSGTGTVASPAAERGTRRSLVPFGETTAIGGAVKQALLAYAGMPLAGVLVISDGQSTAGDAVESAAKLAADNNVPIVTVAVGTPEGPRNARIVSVEVNPVAFVRDTNQVTVHVQSQGMRDARCGLLVETRRNGGAWEELGREDVILGLDGALQTLVFDFSEMRPSKLEFRASLEDVGPELSEDDNVAQAETRIVRERLNVLFLAGSTFPEVQFLRNTLLRDPGIELSSWNMAADKDYEHPGDSPIQRLPLTREELDEYDCVVLYDPNPGGWPANFPDLLTEFVTRSGGGLVYIAGEMQTAALFDQQSDPQNAWLGMLPVVREPGLFRSEVQLKLSARQPWRLDVTEQGLTDPMFAFSQDGEANRRILESLPGMYWHFPVTRAKPGASVLAVHGDPRMRNEFGPEVLLATQLVGPGRTTFIAFDSTYRWRYLDEQFFDGFWARVVDRAGRNKRLGGAYPFRLSTSLSTYQPGDQVKVLARFHDAAAVEPGTEMLPGEVEAGSGEPVPISLVPDDQPGVFSAMFPATRPGMHFVKVWMGDAEAGALVRAATLPVDVRAPNRERENPGVDRTTLELLAESTGGRALDVTQLDELARAFAGGRVSRQLEYREEIWDAPLLFGLLFVLLCVEWVVRKRCRLI
jgi:hypothetical protein